MCILDGSKLACPSLPQEVATDGKPPSIYIYIYISPSLHLRIRVTTQDLPLTCSQAAKVSYAFLLEPHFPLPQTPSPSLSAPNQHACQPHNTPHGPFTPGLFMSALRRKTGNRQAVHDHLATLGTCQSSVEMGLPILPASQGGRHWARCNNHVPNNEGVKNERVGTLAGDCTYKCPPEHLSRDISYSCICASETKKKK